MPLFGTPTVQRGKVLVQMQMQKIKTVVVPTGTTSERFLYLSTAAFTPSAPTSDTSRKITRLLSTDTECPSSSYVTLGCSDIASVSAVSFRCPRIQCKRKAGMIGGWLTLDANDYSSLFSIFAARQKAYFTSTQELGPLLTTPTIPSGIAFSPGTTRLRQRTPKEKPLTCTAI